MEVVVVVVVDMEPVGAIEFDDIALLSLDIVLPEVIELSVGVVVVVVSELVVVVDEVSSVLLAGLPQAATLRAATAAPATRSLRRTSEVMSLVPLGGFERRILRAAPTPARTQHVRKRGGGRRLAALAAICSPPQNTQA